MTSAPDERQSYPQYPSYPGDGGQPTPPSAPLAPVGFPQRIDTLAMSAIIAAVAVGTVDLVRTIAAFASTDTYLAAAQRGDDAADVWTVYETSSLVYFVLLLAAFVATGLLLYRARTNVDLLRPTVNHARRKGWAWGGWVCPVVSLWFPFQVVRDVLRARNDSPTPSVVGWWWGLFIAAFSMSQLGTNLMPTAGPIDTDLVRAVPWLEAIGLVFLLLDLVLWIAVVRRLRTDQRALLAG